MKPHILTSKLGKWEEVSDFPRATKDKKKKKKKIATTAQDYSSK